MVQGSAGTLTRPLLVYRQRVDAAPALLACETLSRAHMTQLWQATQGKGRQRVLLQRFPPDAPWVTPDLPRVRSSSSIRLLQMLQ
jgi:hypothetical protein